MVPLSLFYCMFMLTCFNQEKLIECPCEYCYSAPLNGIDGDDGQSMICGNGTLYDLNSNLNQPILRPINTLVHDPVGLLYPYGNVLVHKMSVQSIVLANGSFREPKKLESQLSLFEALEPNDLRYISIKNIVLTDLWWETLEVFGKLTGISIQDSTQSTLKTEFSSVLARNPNLVMFACRSCELRDIEHNAFNIDNELLRIPEYKGYVPSEVTSKTELALAQLDLSTNQIYTLRWLTSLTRPLKRLASLNLANNRLITLPVDLSKAVPALQRLDLSGNRFRFFSENSVHPLFKIMEANLITLGGLETLQFQPEMEWILKPEVISQVKASGLGDSVFNAVRYITDTGVTDHYMLEKQDFLHYFSDQIQLHQCESMPCLVKFDAAQEKVVLKFQGRQKSAYCSFKSSNEIAFDCLRYWNDDIIRIKKDLEGESKITPIISVQLFDVSHFNYVANTTLGAGKSNFIDESLFVTEKQIANLYDDLEEFLDQAYSLDTYVLVSLWDNLPGVTNPFPDLYKTQILFSPLRDRISQHPAVVGFDIGRFIWNEFPEKPVPKWDRNGCVFSSIELEPIHNQMIFVQEVHMQLRSSTDSGRLERPVGMSVGHECDFCFPIIANAPECIVGESKIELDFVNIINEDEVFGDYSYLKNSEVANWYYKANGKSKVTFFTVKNPADNFWNNEPTLRTSAEIVGGFVTVDTKTKFQ